MCSGFAKLRLATGKCSAYTALLYSTADEWTADVWTADSGQWTADSGPWTMDSMQCTVVDRCLAAKWGPAGK